MREPTPDQTASIESRWTPLWRWLWRCIKLLWGAFILGILDSILATRVTSDKDFPVVSPVGRAMQNLPFTLSLGLSLLLLTALVWTCIHYPQPRATEGVVFGTSGSAQLTDSSTSPRDVPAAKPIAEPSTVGGEGRDTRSARHWGKE